MTDARTTPPSPDRAGWFDDPDDPEQLRYFDGILWTSHTTPRRTIWQGTQAGETTTPDAAAPAQPAHHGSESTGPYGYPAQPPHAGAPHTGAPAPWTPGPAGGPYGPPAGAPYATGPTTADGAPLASMGARFGAWLIDCMITWAVGVALGGYFLYRGMGNYPEIVAEVMREATPPSGAADVAARIQFDTGWLLAFAITQLIVGVAYHTFFLSRSGATPGKRAAGISVRLAERPGVLSASDAMRRSLLRPVLFLFIMTPGLMGAFALPFSLYDAVSGVWHKERRTVHDRIGRTVVVRGSQPRSTPPLQ